MGSSHKGHFQASNSLKSSASLKSSSSGENNENDDIKQDRTGSSKSQNSRKHFHNHFMSPTLSASSKALIVPRKKVLGEKNESVSSFDVQFQNSQKGQLLRPSQGTSQYSARSSSEAFSASDSTDEFNYTSAAADSLSVKPYDPLTNYLSPRPKYLRYNPNKHREMLNRQWCHNRKEEFMKNTVDSINSFEYFLGDSSNKATPSVPNQETVNDSGFGDDDEEEMEEEEEEEEEDEDELEEKMCSLKGVLKFFLLLAVMGLCTSYMFSENSSRTSPMQFQGLKGGSYVLLNHSSEGIPTNLLCAGDGMIMCPLAREAEVDFPERLKNQQSSYQDLGKVQMVVEESSDDDDINVRMLESLNEQNSDIISVTEVDESDTILDHPVLLNVEETADCKELDIEQMDSDLLQQDFAENMILDDGVEGTKTDDGETEQDSDMVEKPDNIEENFMDNTGEELNYSGLEGTADKAVDHEIAEVESERPVIGEAWLKLMIARLVELGQIHIATIAAFSIFAIVLASSSSLLYYYIINHPRTPSKAFSQPIKTETAKLQEQESSQKEKPIQSQPQPYREIECLQKKLESISLKPSTMTFSLEEIRKDLSHISQSPKVEFLGEVVIGGRKVSSTIKKCGKTNNEAEEESSSNHLVTQSDTASTDSPSYGSFTAEKKILKKQGAKDGSVQMITTPVRRSNRLQNRCINSPLRS